MMKDKQHYLPPELQEVQLDIRSSVMLEVSGENVDTPDFIDGGDLFA